MLGSKWALNQAMRNIDAFYPVVGILEDMNSTLSVLQSRLPKFFRGIVKIYRDKLKGKMFKVITDKLRKS